MIPSYPTSAEFAAISAFYGDRRALRSGVPLINHIHEGARIILALRCVLPDGRQFHNYGPVHGYCLHPLFQNDVDLATVGMRYLSTHKLGRLPVALALEYRAHANAWLSDKVTKEEVTGLPPVLRCQGSPSSGPLPEVAAMLVADKVQNYKDFLIHHKGVHTRSDELELYFKTWLDHLQVGEELFKTLCQAATEPASAQGDDVSNTYPCSRCNMDDGSPLCLQDSRCPRHSEKSFAMNLPPLPEPHDYPHWEGRIKSLMGQVGMPESQSLAIAFKQLVNEMMQAQRESVAAAVPDLATATKVYCAAWEDSFLAANPFSTLQLREEDALHISAGISAILAAAPGGER